MKINGIDYGRIDVSGLTATMPGYMVLIAGDYGTELDVNVGNLRIGGNGVTPRLRSDRLAIRAGHEY